MSGRNISKRFGLALAGWQPYMEAVPITWVGQSSSLLRLGNGGPDFLKPLCLHPSQSSGSLVSPGLMCAGGRRWGWRRNHLRCVGGSVLSQGRTREWAVRREPREPFSLLEIYLEFQSMALDIDT